MLTAKLFKQGYRYHKLRKTFSKLYRRHYDQVSKFNVGLKSLLKQGLSESEFYGDLVYKFRNIVGRNDFSDQFRKIIIRYKRTGYNMHVCNRLHAWLLTQSRLTSLLPFLIAAGGSGVRFNGGSGIKFSIKLVGAWCSTLGKSSNRSPSTFKILAKVN